MDSMKRNIAKMRVQSAYMNKENKLLLKGEGSSSIQKDDTRNGHHYQLRTFGRDISNM